MTREGHLEDLLHRSLGRGNPGRIDEVLDRAEGGGESYQFQNVLPAAKVGLDGAGLESRILQNLRCLVCVIDAVVGQNGDASRANPSCDGHADRSGTDQYGYFFCHINK